MSPFQSDTIFLFESGDTSMDLLCFDVFGHILLHKSADVLSKLIWLSPFSNFQASWGNEVF